MKTSTSSTSTRTLFFPCISVKLLFICCAASVLAQNPNGAVPVRLPELKAVAHMTRDRLGIAHIQARNDHDLFFLQGYVHAQDRLFQMDMSRRLANGTLAELLGEGALATDVQLRTIGLHRAAERSLAVLSPRVRSALESYANGVNAAVRTHPLPPEYGALEITRLAPWTPLDSVAVAKLITFQRSFDIDAAPTVTLLTYQQAGQLLGFDGTALYFEDLFRAAPFDPAATVLDASLGQAQGESGTQQETDIAARPFAHARFETWKLCCEYIEAIKDLPVFRDLLQRERRPGSNAWGLSGALTTSGHPMLANDAHLPLGMPALFYPIHLKSRRSDTAGSSVAGVPFVILGHNRRIGWGGTVNYVDVTDTFQEQIVADPNSPSGLSIVHAGTNEPIIPIPEVFRQNNFDGLADNLTVLPPGGAIPPATLIVPRRNHGPIIRLDLANGVGLSVQYTGFSATRELETFLIWNEARNLDDFIQGVQLFDVGSINWVYADVRGNIAFFSSSEVPLREDLQAGAVRGLPPWFIRNGAGGNEWLPVQQPQPGQAVPYEIVPCEEMPRLVNPPAGWFVNANNDALGLTLDNNALNQLRPGGGIFYLTSFHEGYRAGRITEMIRENLVRKGRISIEDMKQMQADTALIDAEVFVPYLRQAFENARSSAEPMLAAFAADARIGEAVQRLSSWDFSTPTGIAEGYDAADSEEALTTPSRDEIAASVAATIYSVWRGQFIRNTVDAPLARFGLPLADDQYAVAAARNLLERFAEMGGRGVSGVSFFDVPAVANSADRRDILILQSLADALDLLAGSSFEAAFHRSTRQDDYRWGKLHRLVLAHPLGGPFSTPPAAGQWPAPLPGLAGIPVDGGFSTVDIGNPSGGVRGNHADGFMFDHGPVHRLICEATPSGIRGQFSTPGGVSGVLGSSSYLSLLPGWLSNDGFEILVSGAPLRSNAVVVTKFVPANP